MDRNLTRGRNTVVQATHKFMLTVDASRTVVDWVLMGGVFVYSGNLLGPLCACVCLDVLYSGLQRVNLRRVRSQRAANLRNVLGAINKSQWQAEGAAAAAAAADPGCVCCDRRRVCPARESVSEICSGGDSQRLTWVSIQAWDCTSCSTSAASGLDDISTSIYARVAEFIPLPSQRPCVRFFHLRTHSVSRPAVARHGSHAPPEARPTPTHLGTSLPILRSRSPPVVCSTQLSRLSSPSDLVIFATRRRQCGRHAGGAAERVSTPRRR